MSFTHILDEMVSSVHGARGAMFVDYEGEAVEVVSRDVPRYDLQVIGAYQGLVLAELQRICARMPCGELTGFKIEWRHGTFFNCVLKDGYFLVLIAGLGTSEVVAWRQLAAYRELLLSEI